MGMSTTPSLLPESLIHDMIVPYLVIESARFGDRARHVLFKGAELAGQIEPGLFIKLQTSSRHARRISIRSTSFHLGSASVRPTVTNPAQGADRSRDPMRSVRFKLYS